MIKELILKNRSYRRFHQEVRVSADILHELIDNARLSASAANLQPLRYIPVISENTKHKVFNCLRWAGYLQDWQGPVEGEKPGGYIVLLGDRDYVKHHHYDAGIAVQSILLGAVEKGLGGCIFAAVDRERLREELIIPANFEILLVVALGKPKEKVVVEEIDRNKDIKYWRDEEGVHHVPKRKLKDIIIERS